MWRHWQSNGGSPKLAKDSHGVGLLRAKNNSHDGGAGLLGLEKPPPQWGGVCECGLYVCWWGAWGRRNPHRSGVCFASYSLFKCGITTREKPPPKWGGACEAITSDLILYSAWEKLPPEWGVLCEWPANRLPISQNGEKPPPKWDPPLSPQVVNVLPTTIAHIHQPGHPIKNSLRDPP